MKGIVGAVLAFTLVGSWTGHGCTKAQASSDYQVDQLILELDRNVKAYRAAGFAWEPSDLGPELNISPEDDATPLLEAAQKETKSVDFQVLRKALEAGDGKAALADMAKFGKAYRLIEQAAEQKGLAWTAKPKSAEISFPQQAQVGFCIKLLDFRAEARALGGDFKGMEADLGHASALLDMVVVSKDEVSASVWLAEKSVHLRSFANCVAAASGDRAELESLRKLLTSTENISFENLVLYQSYDRLWVARNMLNGRLSDDRRLLSTGVPDDKPSKAFVSQYCAAMVSLAPLIKAFPSAPIRITQDWPKKLASTQAGHFVISIKGGHVTFNLGARPSSKEQTVSTVEDYLPNVPLFGARILEIDAVQQCVLALIDTFEYRQTHGRLPGSLKELPSDPGANRSDPFTGGNLVFRVKGKRLWIYCLGADGIDHERVGYGEPEKSRSQPITTA